MHPFKEFVAITATICCLTGGAVVLLPWFSVWTVLPVFAIAGILHFGHGWLYLHGASDALKDPTQKARFQSSVNKITWCCFASTCVILTITTICVVVAGS